MSSGDQLTQPFLPLPHLHPEMSKGVLGVLGKPTQEGPHPSGLGAFPFMVQEAVLPSRRGPGEAGSNDLEIQGAASQETRFEYTGRVSFDQWEEMLKRREDVRGKVKKASSTNTTPFPPLPHPRPALGEAVASFAIAVDRFRGQH